MSKNNQQVLMVLGGIALGLYLLSNPRCGRGCQTLAEHLLSHSLDALL
jgi:hypothetical protein